MNAFCSILKRMMLVALISLCSGAELSPEEADERYADSSWEGAEERYDSQMKELTDMSAIRMEVTSACLDGEMEEAIVSIRLTNESEKERLIPVFRGLPLQAGCLLGYGRYKWREPEEASYWTAAAADSLLAQHFRVSGTSHRLVMRSEPEKTKDEGIAFRWLQPFERRDVTLRFKILDVRAAGEEVFYLRLLHREHGRIFKNRSEKNTLSYKEAKFCLSVTPTALARYQERKQREFTEPAEGKTPLLLSLKSAIMDDKEDFVSLHVQLTNNSEKPVRIGAGFRFKCMANEEDVALVLAEDEGGMRRGDVELAPGEVENMVVEFQTRLIKRTGKSAWKLRPSAPICNDLPFEVMVQKPFGVRELDLQKDETSEDAFVLPDPDRIWEYYERRNNPGIHREEPSRPRQE